MNRTNFSACLTRCAMTVHTRPPPCGPRPASTHLEATAEGAQAGTGPVPASVLAEAESTTGIVGVKTQLPAGIDPDKVWLAPGPTGWALTATAERRRSGWCSEPWTPSWPADRITSVG